jgi:hypothetical protein
VIDLQTDDWVGEPCVISVCIAAAAVDALRQRCNRNSRAWNGLRQLERPGQRLQPLDCDAGAVQQQRCAGCRPQEASAAGRCWPQNTRGLRRTPFAVEREKECRAAGCSGRPRD